MSNLFTEFQIFVKPVGANCNLKCSYCYYLDKGSLTENSDSFLMSDDLLENYIVQHLNSTSVDLVLFSWHGGEPLLAGLEFYKRVVAFQNKHKKPNQQVVNGIQTNATMLNEEWCVFFAKENFTVGISLDGPEDLHDKNRVYKSGKGSFKDLMRGYKLLQKYQVYTEILCVLNSNNVKYPLEIYHFFKSIGANYISFLPMVEKDAESKTIASKDSVPAKEFGEFLRVVFDEWLEKDIGKLKVQIFEEALRTAFNQEHTLCIFKEECGGVPVLEMNGDFYSCDHFVEPSYLLGNLKEDSFIKLLNSERQRDFGKEKKNLLPNYCLQCEVLSMCNGECPKNRFITSPYGEPGLNYLCEGYKLFFNHCKPFIASIASLWEKQY